MGLLLAVLTAATLIAGPRAEIGAGPRFSGTSVTVRFHPSENIVSPTASAFGQKAAFYPGGELQYAVLALPLETMPGSYQVKVDWTENGLPLSETHALRVLSRPGAVKKIILPAKAAKASDALADEKPLLDGAFKQGGALPQWKGCFLLPTAATRLSEEFGQARRYLPGNYLWRHKGLDLAVPEGTPVKASNDAVVVLARTGLKAYGGLVVLSHGYGLCTTYMHMSRVDVAEGQVLAKGDPIGLSGMEGIATGPHLHFQMNLRGFPVDPRPWMDKRELAGLK